MNTYTGIFSQLLKNRINTLLAFEKLDELFIDFWKALRVYEYTFQKRDQVLLQCLKTQMKSNSYLSMLKNF